MQCRLDYRLVSKQLSALVTLQYHIILQSDNAQLEIKGGCSKRPIKSSYRIFRTRYPSSKQSTIIWTTKVSAGTCLEWRWEVSVFNIENERFTGHAEKPKSTLQQQIDHWMNLLKTDDRTTENVSKLLPSAVSERNAIRLVNTEQKVL